MDFSVTTRDILLIGHIGAAILLVGPLIVASSLFPRYALAAQSDRAEGRVARALARITKRYNDAVLVVALLGIALGFESDLMAEPFVGMAIAIFVILGILYFALIIAGQKKAIALLESPGGASAEAMAPIVKRLRMSTGIAGLLWAVIVVLMVVKP